MLKIDTINGSLSPKTGASYAERMASRKKMLNKAYVKIPQGCQQHNDRVIKQKAGHYKSVDEIRTDDLELWHVKLVHTYKAGDYFGELALEN